MRTNLIEKKFIYLALIFGLVFIVLTPPFQAPDENNHFKKAYVLSKGNFFPEEQDGKAGFLLPREMVEYIEEQNQKGGKLDEKFEFKDLYMRERLPAQYSKEEFYNFATCNANPLGHIVQASGIVFGRILSHVLGVYDTSVVYELYFARLFNLLFYVCVIAISIVITPILKGTIAMIGLMPMALFQASTASYDALLISLAFLATALIFNVSFGEKPQKLTWFKIIILGVIAYVFVAIKIVYLPLFLLLLFLPKREMKDKRNYIIKLLAFFGIVIGLYLIVNIITPNLDISDTAERTLLVTEQIRFVVGHPFEYCKIFFHTIIELRQYLISTTIGTFGLIDTNLYCVFLGLYIILMPIIGISEISLDGENIRIIDRLAVAVSVFSSVFGCFLAMYILWTPTQEGYGVGAASITGVQGRYFIPMIPVAFLMFSNQKLKEKIKLRRFMCELVDNFILLVIIMLCASTIALLLRYWC